MILPVLRPAPCYTVISALLLHIVFLNATFFSQLCVIIKMKVILNLLVIKRRQIQ